MNHLAIKSALATAAAVGLIAGAGAAAHASSNAEFISKTVTRSATHRIAYVKMTVECSDDTDSAVLSVRLTQVTPAGTVQQATGTVASIGAFECSGDPEQVTVPVRRPVGGFSWQAGAAVADHGVFATHDPSGNYLSFVPKTTVTIK